MLRIKRSVQAQYNTEVNFISAQILATRQAQQSGQVQGVPSNGSSVSEISAPEISNAMQIAEQEAMQNKANLPSVAKSMTFVPSSTQVNKENVSSNPSNPDEITMDMDDDDL